MATLPVKTGLLGRLAPEAERFIYRHILGVQPDPDHWPQPDDVGMLPVPNGIVLTDKAGRTFILDREFSELWHHRRTAVGAAAFRFAENGEYDCGWRIADVAARFVERCDPTAFDCVTIIPPPITFGQTRILPWIGARLAQILNVANEPSLIETTAPIAAHPDLARKPALLTNEMFNISQATAPYLAGSRVLLIDWRYHKGHTLLAIARMLRKRGADVTRFAFLG